jgi:hypothetical protein
MAKTKHPTTILKQWMRDATPEQQQALADIATSGSRNGLYQIAGQHRQTRPGKAALIERATREMNAATKGALPVVYRTDLSQECAQCEYAQKCLGAIALRADFPVADDQ